eukprot:TRINITY_DN22469_c0_g2_i3.p1 TRINITY_DN22469_c0_g2~~TRINITY_DN22469_c0_g2_i3.p1  ORF type:complete len:133 (+),score=18.51 TRINITY_DN22469_c0_g2_i3:292-690(+)
MQELEYYNQPNQHSIKLEYLENQVTQFIPDNQLVRMFNTDLATSQQTWYKDQGVCKFFQRNQATTLIKHLTTQIKVVSMSDFLYHHPDYFEIIMATDGSYGKNDKHAGCGITWDVEQGYSGKLLGVNHVFPE